MNHQTVPIHEFTKKLHVALLTEVATLSTTNLRGNYDPVTSIRQDTLICKLPGDSFMQHAIIARGVRDSLIKTTKKLNDKSTLKTRVTFETLVFHGHIIINLYYKS